MFNLKNIISNWSALMLVMAIIRNCCGLLGMQLPQKYKENFDASRETLLHATGVL
jgi:hypothetical protein